jgi:hypothetical protein
MRAASKHFAAMAAFSLTTTTLASTTNYTGKTAFLAAVPGATSIDFTGLSDNAVMSTQYSGLGIVFTQGDDLAITSSSFVTDQKGVCGDGLVDTQDTIAVQFATPITGLGCDFPGALAIRLFVGVTEVGFSGQFGSSGTGFFGGITSTVPFDRAMFTDPFDGQVFIDNLYFSPVPEPSIPAAAALIMALATRRRRRTRPHQRGRSATPTR